MSHKFLTFEKFLNSNVDKETLILWKNMDGLKEKNDKNEDTVLYVKDASFCP